VPPDFDSDHLVVGRLLPGTQYRLESKLGEGVMGEVWKAIDEGLRRPVVLKILKPAKSEELFRRMRREAQVLAGIRHPSLATIYGFGKTTDDRPFIVMEFLEGVVLRQLLLRDRVLPIERACACGSEALLGLAAAHREAIIHRDIKPENLLATVDGRLRVIDFGLAKFVGDDAADQSGPLTAPGMIMGTPRYMAPEQIRMQRLTPAVDIYAMGCVLMEMLTGTPPFDTQVGAQAVLAAHLFDKPPTLKQRTGREFPKALEAAVAKMLEKERANRYDNAAHVAGVLSDIARAHAQVDATPEVPIPAAVRLAAGLLTASIPVPSEPSTMNIQTMPIAVPARRESPPPLAADDAPKNASKPRGSSDGLHRLAGVIIAAFVAGSLIALVVFLVTRVARSTAHGPSTPLPATTTTPSPATLATEGAGSISESTTTGATPTSAATIEPLATLGDPSAASSEATTSASASSDDHPDAAPTPPAGRDVASLLAQARMAENQGRMLDAKSLYRAVLRIDHANAIARAGLQRLANK
jgi:serine/threonine-protein kinase